MAQELKVHLITTRSDNVCHCYLKDEVDAVLAEKDAEIQALIQKLMAYGDTNARLVKENTDLKLINESKETESLKAKIRELGGNAKRRMGMTKYKLTDETKEFFGSTLHRIVCVTAFANVAAGELGGWIESEKNLDQYGNAWVSGNAQVYGNAEVYGNAWVSGNARVYGDAKVSGDAEVYGDAWVYGNAQVYGNAEVYGNARVSGDAKVEKTSDYIVLKNNWTSGRYFTYTISNKRWKVGCFYGTGDELIKKAYADSELSGKCYEAAVRYVEALEKKLQELDNSTAQ